MLNLKKIIKQKEKNHCFGVEKLTSNSKRDINVGL